MQGLSAWPAWSAFGSSPCIEGGAATQFKMTFSAACMTCTVAWT